LGIIVPAAGGSRRLGQAKQLLPVAGEALVRRIVRIAASLGPRQLVVVTGAHQAPVTKAINDLPATIVHHAGWQSGMGSSIAAGAKWLDQDLDGIMILLCDQWRVSPDDLERMVANWRQDVTRLSVARWRETFGPPAIFPSNLLPRLCALEGDRGARSLIAEQGPACRFTDMPNAEFDLDTPDDLSALEREND
jgi:molybdenum cofactor cytidylyltransferase